jgi:hypothetical protein
MRHLALTLTAFLGLVVFAQPATAGPTDGGAGEAEGRAETIRSPGDRGGEVVSHVRVADGSPSGGGGGHGPGESHPGGMESSQGLVTTHWRDTGVGCPHGEAQGRPVGDDPDGRIFELVRVDRTTEPPTETIMIGQCFSIDDPPPASEPPPPPPTVEEITNVVRALISPPPIKVNPDWGGVTGLESWFWYDGQDEVAATATIRGYSVTATARPARYYWDPCADYTPPEGYRTSGPRGCQLLESTHPGHEPAHDGDGREAAVQFLYETRGMYEIRHQAVWEGSWSFTGPVGAIASGRLATIRATSARPGYEVEEIRSELHDGR